MKLSIYLNAHLHNLFLPFTEPDTHPVKSGICLYAQILNLFFVRNLFGS